MTRRILIMLTLVIAQAIPAVAQSREKDLDQWLERDLVPYVQEQLLQHPRFKNETVMFVVLRDNAPASASNGLALSIRDQLLAAAVSTPGVSIGWQQGRGGTSLDLQRQECSHDDVHYYIGIELTQKLDSTYAVTVRALDLEDRNWVTGFGKRWQGRLSTTQRQAMRQSRIDETFLGARDVPFTLAQTDLLAAQLAHKLACTLQKRVSEEYVVAAELTEPDAPELRGTVELVSNNLANRQALAFSSDAETSNASLSGKAHHIDGVLYQYWITVTPNDASADVSALGASAYVILPNADVALAATPPVRVPVEKSKAERPAVVSVSNAGKDALISPLRIVRPESLNDCGSGGIRLRAASYQNASRTCSLLRTEARENAIVFFLEHQANYGLVRLSDNECRERTTPRIARGGRSVSFPIASTTTSSRNWRETYEWQVAPDLDTYYAVVVTDAGVARRIANHIDDLPMRCSKAVRPGLEDDALRAWLADFAMLTASSAKHVDWRALQVKDVL